jgi:hypothetical protein
LNSAAEFRNEGVENITGIDPANPSATAQLITGNTLPTSGLRRAYTTGNLILNNIGTNSHITHLYVQGNLYLQGTCSFPNLEAVYVTGDIIISTGTTVATITGNNRQGINSNGDPSGPTVFIGRNYIARAGSGVSQLGVGNGTRVDNCIFNMHGNVTIEFNAQSLLKYTGNSVHIAGGTAPGTNGNVLIGSPSANSPERLFVGSVNEAPQFYGAGNLGIHLFHNETRVYGLYAVLGNYNGSRGNQPTNTQHRNQITGGVYAGGSFTGIVQQIGQGIVQPAAVTQSNLEINSVTQFPTSENNIANRVTDMLPLQWGVSGGGDTIIDAGDDTILSVNFEGMNSRIEGIRETTGIR